MLEFFKELEEASKRLVSRSEAFLAAEKIRSKEEIVQAKLKAQRKTERRLAKIEILKSKLVAEERQSQWATVDQIKRESDAEIAIIKEKLRMAKRARAAQGE